MNTISYTSNNPCDTILLAKQLASKLEKKDVIVLTGDLRFWKNKIH